MEPGSWEPLEVAERILRESGATVQHGVSKAFYAPGPDLIQLPPAAAFDCSGDYYATALHELTHWTGHPSRCDRPLGAVTASMPMPSRSWSPRWDRRS